MKKALVCCIAALLLFACIAPAFAAGADNGDTIVYITDHGDKYHMISCGSLWNSCTAITLESAVMRGYGRCARCHPPLYNGIVLTPTPEPTPKQTKPQAEQSGNNGTWGGTYTRPGTISEAETEVPKSFDWSGAWFWIAIAVLLAVVRCVRANERRRAEKERLEAEKQAFIEKYAGKNILAEIGAPPQFRRSSNCDILVYVNLKSKKYHTAGCRYAAGCKVMSIAHTSALAPCKKCNPGMCPDWLREYKKILAEAQRLGVEIDQ